MSITISGSKGEGLLDGVTKLFASAVGFLEVLTAKAQSELKHRQETSELQQLKSNNLRMELQARQAELEARIAKAEAEKRKAEGAWRVNSSAPQEKKPHQPHNRNHHPRKSRNQRAQGEQAVAQAAPVVEETVPPVEAEPQQHEEVHEEHPVGRPLFAQPLTQKIKGLDKLQLSAGS